MLIQTIRLSVRAGCTRRILRFPRTLRNKEYSIYSLCFEDLIAGTSEAFMNSIVIVRAIS